jgi:hypothetical protein
MDNQPSADSSITPSPTLPRRGVPVDADLARFSPLTAPEREAIDSFCRDSRPWALRQARRAYRHLPDSLREQAVDRALTEMRTRTPTSVERRALAAELATRLTEALRHVHVGWCLNESSALLRREGTEPVQPEVHREDLANFVDQGLGGLERAVLQLEIGAGRDTRSARAALRLHPRQYSQQREAGLSKLRDAISAQVIGRACDQHVSSIVAAATGDRTAMESLSAGPRRCRYCAREAQGLRSVLHERLAIAPWPVAFKPAGLLAAKLGALGALFGGKGVGGGATVAALGSGGGSGATMAASVLAAAALATGTAAVVGHHSTPRERLAGHGASALSAGTPAGHTTRNVVAGAAARPAATAKAKTHRAATRVHRHHTAARHRSHANASTPAPATAAATAVAATAGSTSSSGAVSAAAKPVVDAVKDTTDKITSKLPSKVAAPVQTVVDTVGKTVGDVGKTVDGLLHKK